MDPASGRSRRAAAGLPAVALILLTACSSGGAPASPRQALLTAAVYEQQVSTAVETITYNNADGTFTTRMITYQLKPAIEYSDSERVTRGSQVVRQERAVVTPRIIYTYMGPPAGYPADKPWATATEYPIGSHGPAGIAYEVPYGNYLYEAQLFSAAASAHVAGPQTVGGVRTTEYAGSFRYSAAYRAMPARLRRFLFSPQYFDHGVVTFAEWIDGAGHMRKMTVTQVGVTTTFTIASAGQPVRITPPPASEIDS